MLYTNPQGKKFNIPDDYLSKQMQNLGVSKWKRSSFGSKITEWRKRRTGNS